MAVREERTLVKLTRAEIDLLTKAATAAGLSLASYTRTRALAAAEQENNERAAWKAK